MFHNKTHTISANENVILDSAVGNRSQFEFTLRLSENASVSESVFAGLGYQVTIHGEQNVTVRKLAGSS